MAVLSKIADVFQHSNVGWCDVAKNLGYDETPIEEFSLKDNPAREFVDSLTIRIWETIFRHFDIKSNECESSTISDISKLADIFGKKPSRETVEKHDEDEKEKTEYINVIDEISCRVSEWRAFGRVLAFPETYLDNLDKTVIEKLNEIPSPYKLHVERNKYLMNDALKKFSKEDSKADFSSWKYWHCYLEKFANGKEVICEIERFFPKLILETSSGLVHATSSMNITYIGHPILYQKVLKLDKSDVEIAVNIGSNKFQMIDLQQYTEWVATQQRYMDIYNVFKDMLIFNFKDLYEPCPVLHTFEKFIKDTGEIGFATKGYHLTQHISLFNQGVFVNDDKYENYFLFLGKFNTAIYLTKCCKEPGEALYYSAQNIQMTNALHEKLQSKDIIQVNVLIDNSDENRIFCSGCFKKNLYIKEDVLTDLSQFTPWFSKLQSLIFEVKQKLNVVNTSSNENVVHDIKRDMITFEASKNSDFPSFSYVGEDQMSEMKKCVLLLTLVQYEILNTNQKHIFVRGPYGCGKTIVLLTKFEKIVMCMNEKDILYLICNDQQSEFMKHLKSFQLQYPEKLIVLCNSKLIAGRDKIPSLSCILNHIYNVWKGRTVHVLIDEFNGSYITKSEVSMLKDILPKFLNSFIVVALQSMEEALLSDLVKDINSGYQYSLLKENTSFTVYDLNYSLRCSSEITEFVNITSKFMEFYKCVIFFASRESNYEGINNICLDKEFGQEYFMGKVENLSVITKKYLYNQSSETGHSSSNGPVSAYLYDKFKLDFTSTDKMKKIGSNRILSRIYSVYIAVIEHILSELPCNESYVICTFDEKLYNIIYHYLQNESVYCWTCKINNFIEKNSIYDILLTDYASIRGYEFPNVIFLLRFGTDYLKYRMIECFTRATTKLHVIADNINLSYDSKDNELINVWKQLHFVDYFDLQYDESEDTIYFLQDGEMQHSKILFPVSVALRNMFPWSQPRKILEKIGNAKISDDIYNAICCLCLNDNINLFHEFLNIHNIDILSYCYDDIDLLRAAVYQGGINICRSLLSGYKFDVNSHPEYESTLLHVSAQYNHFEIAKLLIENNAIVNLKDDDDETPLHITVYDADLFEVAELLVKNNANVNAININGETPLHIASQYGRAEMVKLLLENNADVYATTDEVFTPLHFAAKYGHAKIVELLLEANGDISGIDDRGRTPLHLAAQYGHVRVAQLLLENNANISALDKIRQSPIHTAQLHNQFEIVELLEKYESTK